MQKPHLVTAEELFEMGKGFELFEGKLNYKPPVGVEHSLIGATVLIHLGNHVMEHGLGSVFNADVGFIFSRDPDVVLSPDVSFICRDRMSAIVDRTDYPVVVPDLAVEVISQSETYGELNEKERTYIDSGVQLVWVINPSDHTVMVHSPDNPLHMLTERDELDGGDVVPGFTIQIAEIFGRSTLTAS